MTNELHHLWLLHGVLNLCLLFLNWCLATSIPLARDYLNFHQLSSVAEKMGKATRWLKAVLGLKREKFSLDSAYSVSGDKKETKRWSFRKSRKDSDAANKFWASSSISDATWLKSYVAEAMKGQNEQAIVVAAATAVAADAAVAAAEAAAAVVKLTSHGRGTMPRGGRERRAVVKIQTAVRGFLVRCFSQAGFIQFFVKVDCYLVLIKSCDASIVVNIWGK